MLKRKFDAKQQWSAMDNYGMFRMLSFSMTRFTTVMESSVTAKAAMYGSARSCQCQLTHPVMSYIEHY